MPAGESLRQLRSDGFVLLRGCEFSDGETVDAQAVGDLMMVFGQVSARDGGTLIWPVRPATTDSGATFSVRAGAAEWHTDAAYRAVPEDFVALLCVRPADDGGVSRLLHERHARAGMDADVVTALRRPGFSWCPPAVFGGPSTRCFPVLTPDTVRWRWDNLVVARAHRPAARMFREHLATAAGALELPLEAGDVLVFDNRRMLHARTAFTDPRRHLLRVRLWDRPGTRAGGRR
jgi:alpha-ketoglutarate-dependent taurine dioxygenase